MKVNLPILLVLLMLILTGISGCLTGGDDDDSTGDPSGADIDETGGWVIPDNIPISLYFPENSLSGSTKISIMKTDDIPKEEGLVEDLGFDLGPDGTRFDIPVHLSINYSGVDLPEGVEDYMLRIFKVEEDGFTFIADGEVDIETKTVKGKISSFSKYVVMGKDYGMILTQTKKRVAPDDRDTVTIGCWVKHLKKGDTSEPTGDPKSEVQMEFRSQVFDSTGKAVKFTKLFLYNDTNKYGFASFAVETGRDDIAMGEWHPRYAIIMITVYISDQHRIYCSLRVDYGSDWPYYNHFDDDLGDEWTSYSIEMEGQKRTYIGPNPIDIVTSPNGKESFLGLFTTDKVVLKLENIPKHHKIIIEFDFIAIGPWKWKGGVDQNWIVIDNDPDEIGYWHCNSRISIQEDDLTGGYEAHIIDTLGYDTSPLVYYDLKNEEVILKRGDLIRSPSTSINHYKESIEIAFTVDERGFGKETDVGQYWGIDNVYVRYVEYREV